MSFLGEKKPEKQSRLPGFRRYRLTGRRAAYQIQDLMAAIIDVEHLWSGLLPKRITGILFVVTDK